MLDLQPSRLPAGITAADKMFDKDFLSCTATAKLMASQHMDAFSTPHKLIGQNISAGDKFLNQNFIGMTALERVMGPDMAAINSVNKLNARMWGEGSATAKFIEQQKQMLGSNAFIGTTSLERVMGPGMPAISSVNELNARMWGEGSVTAKLIEQQKQMLGSKAFVDTTSLERVMGPGMNAINSVNKLNAHMWGERSMTAKFIEQQKQMLGSNAFNKMFNDDMFGPNSVHKLLKDNSMFVSKAMGPEMTVFSSINKRLEADFGVSAALRKGLERDILNVNAFNKMVGVDPFAHTAFQKMANDISGVASVQKLMGSSAMLAALQHPPEWMTAKNAMFDIIETNRKHMELVKPMHDLLKLGPAASQFVGITYDALGFRDGTVFGTADAAFSKPPAVEPLIRAPELDHFCSLHWFIGLGINDLGEYLERTEQILSANAGQMSDSVILLRKFVRERYDDCVRRHDRPH